MKKILSLFAAITILSAQAKEYIIKFKDVLSLNQKALTVRGFGRIAFSDTHAPGKLAKINLNAKAANTAKILDRIMKSPDVEYVVESFKLHAVADINLSQL